MSNYNVRMSYTDLFLKECKLEYSANVFNQFFYWMDISIW